MLHLSESERATMFAGVPTMLLAQLDHPDFAGRDLSGVRCAFSGGATVPPALVRRVESALGVPLSIVFAQTEASPSITQTRLDDSPADRAETLGRPHPQVEVKIADPAAGETVQAGAVGEILIRGGENIYPREIEQLLHARPEVADVAVVGVPDDHWGEQVAAFVRTVPGKPVTQEELASYCRTHLASHKTPRHWVFVDAFPLTPSGKVQKYVLRERFTSGGTAASQ